MGPFVNDLKLCREVRVVIHRDIQWRNQDFSAWCTSQRRGVWQPIIWQSLYQNCMKMTENEPTGGAFFRMRQ